MKTTKQGVFVGLLTALSVCCALNGAEPTNLLSIHFATGKMPRRSIHYGLVRPDEVESMSQPVLADRDFVAWDTTNHTFAITPEAAKRLARKIWEACRKDEPGHGDGPYIDKNGYYFLIEDIPFVLKTAGEPIYVGWFDTGFSAQMHQGVLLTPRPLTISTNLTTNVIFYVRWDWAKLNTNAEPHISDVRNDPRIVAAVQKLFGQDKK